MFNWTTTTIVNALPNIKVGKTKVRIDNKIFEKRWVESIRKKVGNNEVLPQLTLDMEDVITAMGEAQIGRLYIYVGLEGSAESIYANDFYQKGMPLSVSFNKDNTEGEGVAAKNMADAIVSTVNKFNAFTRGKKILDVTANAGVLTIKGTHEYQRIKKVAVLVPGTYSYDEETVVMEWTPNATVDGFDNVQLGKNGFGTYSHLIKDLRLPTAVNTGWTSTTKNEIPTIGSLYNQYIITYYAPSASNPSFTAVGNRSMSETTHVYWVRQDLVTAWETALKEIDPEGNGLETNTVAKAGASLDKGTSLIEPDALDSDEEPTTTEG